MKLAAKSGYRSPLRDAHTAATRKQILDAMATLIEAGAEPTYAAIASRAGVQERTVYRHFPSKDELYEAFWWSVVDARLGRTGYDASDVDDIVRDVRHTFEGFDRHAALVTEMLHSRHGLAIRLRTNDRRTAMFERVAKTELPDADAATRRRAAALVQLLYSGMAWHTMRAYWSMDAATATACVEQGLRAMFAGLRAETRAKKRTATSKSKSKSKPGGRSAT